MLAVLCEAALFPSELRLLNEGNSIRKDDDSKNEIPKLAKNLGKLLTADQPHSTKLPGNRERKKNGAEERKLSSLLFGNVRRLAQNKDGAVDRPIEVA